MIRMPSQLRARRGVSMVESLIAISIVAISGGALLASLGAATQASHLAAETLIARGLAEQLMDEVSAVRFPSSSDSRPGNSTRIDFDDIDDYQNWSHSPPVNRIGISLGIDNSFNSSNPIRRPDSLRVDASQLSNLRRTVDVESVVLNGSGQWVSSSSPTDFRRVTVRVTRINKNSDPQLLAERSRILINVPHSP